MLGSLPCPSYDICSNENGDFIIVGGGGSVKSGVINQVIIADINSQLNAKENDFLKDKLTIPTDEKLYNSVFSSKTIEGLDLLFFGCDEKCVVVEISKDNNYKIHTSFITDYTKLEGHSFPSVNCFTMIYNNNKSYLITGGEDGIIRCWTVNVNGNDTNSNSVSVTSCVELSKHHKAIMSLDCYPQSSSSSSKPWVVSASKDGSIKICDVSKAHDKKKNCELFSFNCSSGTSTTAVEVRGVAWSPHADRIYAIQCNRGGGTYLTSFKVIIESNSSNIDLKPLNATLVCKVPSTRMCLSSCGRYLAVGSSDGAIHVLHVSNKERGTINRITTRLAHSFPVTGLAFMKRDDDRDDYFDTKDENSNYSTNGHGKKNSKGKKKNIKKQKKNKTLNNNESFSSSTSSTATITTETKVDVGEILMSVSADKTFYRLPLKDIQLQTLLTTHLSTILLIILVIIVLIYKYWHELL